MIRTCPPIPAFLLGLLVALLMLPAAAFAQEEGEPAPPELPAAAVSPDTPAEELVLRLVPLTREELAAAAETWLGIVRAKTEEVVEAQIEASQGEGDAAADARERLAELTAERKRLFGSYAAVLDAWEKKAGDEAAIAGYRAYRSAIIIDETRSADFRTLLRQVRDWAFARDGGVALAINVGVVVGSIFALLVVARAARGVAGRAFRRIPNLSRLLHAFLVVTVYWLVLALGLMVVLSALGVDVTPVFALIGGASFILAFALQSTLGNLAAGLMIMINRPFDEGDYVTAGGVGGTVRSVSIVSTTVVTPDNQVIMIPNAQVWGGVITNVTTSPTRRVDLEFGIGYDDDIALAQQVLEEVVRAHPLVLADPEPVIRVNALGPSSVDFVVRPWTRGDDYWTVYWDLTRQVKEAFDARGISIPFPQQDVHLHGLPKAPVTEPGAPRAT